MGIVAQRGGCRQEAQSGGEQVGDDDLVRRVGPGVGECHGERGRLPHAWVIVVHGLGQLQVGVQRGDGDGGRVVGGFGSGGLVTAIRAVLTTGVQSVSLAEMVRVAVARAATEPTSKVPALGFVTARGRGRAHVGEAARQRVGDSHAGGGEGPGLVRVTVKVTVSPTLGRGFETVLVRPRSAPLAGSTKFGSEPNVNFTSLIWQVR